MSPAITITPTGEEGPEAPRGQALTQGHTSGHPGTLTPYESIEPSAVTPEKPPMAWSPQMAQMTSLDGNWLGWSGSLPRGGGISEGQAGKMGGRGMDRFRKIQPGRERSALRNEAKRRPDWLCRICTGRDELMQLAGQGPDGERGG